MEVRTKGEACLSLVVPLVGHSWLAWHNRVAPDNGQIIKETLYPAYLDERVPATLFFCEEGKGLVEGKLLRTLLQETYNPQLKLGSHLLKEGGQEVGSCLWMWSTWDEYFILLRLFPTGGGVITLHKPMSQHRYVDVSKELLKFTDSHSDALKNRAELRNGCISPLIAVAKRQLGDGFEIEVIGTANHFPVYAITALSGVDGLESWSAIGEKEFLSESEEKSEAGEDRWSLARLAQLTGRVLHDGENVDILNAPRVMRHLSDSDPVKTLNFSLDRRVFMMVGRRGASVATKIADPGNNNSQFPDYIAGSFVNLVEIMWNRLFMLVWLNSKLDSLAALLEGANSPGEMRELQRQLYSIRRSLFLLLKDPGCFLFDGGSVTDIADFLLERFWIARQEELLKSKIALLDDLLASWQVLRAYSRRTTWDS